VPRTWGYIIVLIAALVGVGSLMLPVPESIEVAKIEQPEEARERPVPARPQQRAKPAPPKAAKKAPPAPPKPFPMQDTTKARQMVTPPRPNG